MPTSPSLLAMLLLGQQSSADPRCCCCCCSCFCYPVALEERRKKKRRGRASGGRFARETGHPFGVTTESGVAPLSWKQGGWAAWRGWAGRRGGFSQSERRFTRAPAETATGRGSRSPWAIRSAGPTPPPARSLTSGRGPCLDARRGGATSKRA